MSNDILIDDSSAMAGNLVASVEAIANAVKDSGASFTSAFENLSKDFNSGFSRFIDSSKSMNSELLKALNSLKINITQNFKSSNAKAKAEGERVSSILDAKFDKYFSGATEQKILETMAEGISGVREITEKQLSEMSKSGGKSKGKAPDFEKIFKENASDTASQISDVVKTFGDAFKPKEIASSITYAIKPIEDKLSDVSSQISSEISNAIKPLVEVFELKKEEPSSILEKKFDKYFSGEPDRPVGLSGFSSVYGMLESTLIADAERAGSDLYTALEPIYSVSGSITNSFDDISGAANPLIETLRILDDEVHVLRQAAANDIEFYLQQLMNVNPRGEGSYQEQLRANLQATADIYGVSENQSQAQQAQTYSGGQAYELQNPPDQTQPTMFARQFYPLPNAQQQNNPLTTVQGMMPSLFSQISGDIQKAGSEFGKILTPIFGNLGGTFGKAIAPFFTNPIAQVGKNLMQSGLQTAAGGAQGFGAFGGAGAMVGGAATAALGVGVVGFGAALTAVTTSVKMAGQVINSMASYVAKFSPATAEQMNLVFNDLQAVIGKALLPVFNAAIPIVRQFADFINFAMNALTPSIGIVTEAFQAIIPPLIELGATLIDAFMPVIRFAVSLLKGLAMVLEPIINGFAVLVDSVSMMFEIFTKGMDITQLMINGFKLIADVTNILVGAFNWVVAAFYAGVGTLMKVLADAIDWVDGPGRGEWSKGIMEMGDEAIAGAKKIQTVSEEQMQAGLDGKKFSYKAGSLKGKEDIKKNSSFGMAVREAQAMSIESLGDTIRKAAITAQAPESQDKQEEYMKTVSENTAYEKQKKAMVDAIKESGLVDNSNQAIDFGKPDTTYSGGGGDFEIAAPFVG